MLSLNRRAEFCGMFYCIERKGIEQKTRREG
jgi:hypothetical protein